MLLSGNIISHDTQFLYYFVYHQSEKNIVIGPYPAHRQPNGRIDPPRRPSWLHSGWQPYPQHQVDHAMLDNALDQQQHPTYYRIPHHRILKKWIEESLLDADQALHDRRFDQEVDFCFQVVETESGHPVIRYTTLPPYSLSRSTVLHDGWHGPWTIGDHRLDRVLRPTGFESLEMVSPFTFEKEALKPKWWQRLINHVWMLFQ